MLSIYPYKLKLGIKIMWVFCECFSYLAGERGEASEGGEALPLSPGSDGDKVMWTEFLHMTM